MSVGAINQGIKQERRVRSREQVKDLESHTELEVSVRHPGGSD